MKKYTLQQCIDDSIVIHCRTEEEANEYCRAMYKLRKEWLAGQSYLDKNYWAEGDGNIWYSPAYNMYSSRKRNFRCVIAFDQLDLRKEIKPKKFMKVVGATQDKIIYQCEECGRVRLKDIILKESIPQICNCQMEKEG